MSKSDDLISRRAAIDAVRAFYDEYIVYDNGKSIEDLISELPSAEPETRCIAKITMTDEQVREVVKWAKCEILAEQPETQWIPCSERLPEKCGVYLVSGSSRVWLCELVRAITVYGWANDVRNPVVTAWMPLPEPYEERRTDE